MAQLIIQIHLERASELDLGAIRHLCEALTRDRPDLIQRCTLVEREENGPYVDVFFETNLLADLWGLLRPELYEQAAFSAILAMSSIVVCEGEHGWDGYRLLHHFDSEQNLDSLI